MSDLRDWAHPATSALGLGPPPPTSAPGLGSPRPHSAPGLGSPLPPLHWDWAHRCHICAGVTLGTGAHPRHIIACRIMRQVNRAVRAFGYTCSFETATRHADQLASIFYHLGDAHAHGRTQAQNRDAHVCVRAHAGSHAHTDKLMHRRTHARMHDVFMLAGVPERAVLEAHGGAAKADALLSAFAELVPFPLRPVPAALIGAFPLKLRRTHCPRRSPNWEGRVPCRKGSHKHGIPLSMVSH